MSINPQKQSRISESKFSSISKLVAYEAFIKEKQQRKNIEEERKNIELSVANLYRQAKKVSKQLSNTQAELVEQLNRKSEKQEEQRLKLELHKLKEEQLNQMKNNNSLSRYMSMLKREEAKRRLVQQNKEMSLHIKEKQKMNSKLKKNKEIEQNRMIWEKNVALQNSLKVNVQLAKAKNLYQKKCLSSVVRNDLLSIQNERINQQKSAIEQLTNKKKQLKELFSKAKQQNYKYQSILRQGKSRSFIEMYELVTDKECGNPSLEKKRKRSHNKKKNFSESKIAQTYFAQDLY